MMCQSLSRVRLLLKCVCEGVNILALYDQILPHNKGCIIFKTLEATGTLLPKTNWNTPVSQGKQKEYELKDNTLVRGQHNVLNPLKRKANPKGKRPQMTPQPSVKLSRGIHVVSCVKCTQGEPPVLTGSP